MKFDADKVIICSFTKAAAVEIARKLREKQIFIPQQNVGTLHSLCYRAMGNPELAESHVKEWNAACGPNVRLDYVDTADPYSNGQTKSGDKLFRRYQLLRAAKQPENRYPLDVLSFARQWDEWKAASGFVDFTDLIDFGRRELDCAPGMPKTLFVDEAQDLNPMQIELVEKWAENTEWTIMVGDPDQCQPPESKVLTTEGYKTIEQLDPETDRLVCFDRDSGAIVGFKQGYSFDKGQRRYFGHLIKVCADGKEAEGTEDHRWLARFNATARHLHCVYLMRQGNRFRVGWCNLFSGTKSTNEFSFHLGIRARLEKADAVWILRITHNHTDSSIWESVIAARYGLPTVPFQQVHGARTLTQRAIDTTFELLGYGLKDNALECLKRHNLRLDRPFWTPGLRTQYGRHGWMRVAACNLIPEVMEIPVHISGRFYKSSEFTIERRVYEGDVYSLGVDKHENYITSGIITHNSIYTFAGADPYSFVNAPADQKFHPASLKRFLEAPKGRTRMVYRLDSAHQEPRRHRF